MPQSRIITSAISKSPFYELPKKAFWFLSGRAAVTLSCEFLRSPIKQFISPVAEVPQPGEWKPSIHQAGNAASRRRLNGSTLACRECQRHPRVLHARDTAP